MTKPFLEVRIPASPTPTFFNRIQLIIHSIRSLGGPFADAYARVTFNPSVDFWEKGTPFTRAQMGGMDEVCYISQDEMNTWANTTNKYAAAILERFKPPFNSEYVLLLDADVVAVQDFSGLFPGKFEFDHEIKAVMAHVPPFAQSLPTWHRLFDDFHITHEPNFTDELTGYPFMSPVRYSPPYFNTGMVLAKASALEAMADSFNRAVEFVRNKMDTYFIDQIALTLAMADAEVSYKPLPVVYNFPNDPSFDQHYPKEVKEVKFLHFLRSGVIDRVGDFEDMAAMKRLVARGDLTGSNEVFRKRVGELLPLMEEGI